MREGTERERIGICVSGGLDSKTVAARLTERGMDIRCYCADLGQPDEDDIQDVVRRMAPTGAITRIVDARNAMAKACLLVVRCQATYDGGYWNTTGIARAVTVSALLSAMQEDGCTVLAHGATGRGNDQVRFERYTLQLAPQMRVYAPWRDPEMLAQFPGRREMAAYLVGRGIEAEAGPRKRYSTDANLAGLSHEAEDLESLGTSCRIVDPKMGVWPEDAPDAIERIRIDIEHGVPVALDGQRLAPLALMQEANARAGRNGVGMKNALENRIIGTKSRGVYEAPGMELLGCAVAAIHQATLDRPSARLFAHLSSVVSDAVYDGRLFEPAAAGAIAGIEALTRTATGSVTFGMYRGTLHVESMSASAHGLYREEDASMEASNGLNPTSAQGFLDIAGVSARTLAAAGQIHPNPWER